MFSVEISPFTVKNVAVLNPVQDAIDFLVYVLSGKPKIRIITIEHHHFSQVNQLQLGNWAILHTDVQLPEGM